MAAVCLLAAPSSLESLRSPADLRSLEAWGAPVGSRAAAQDDPLSLVRRRYAGTWRLAVGEARAQRVIDRAVTRAASQMSFVVRPFAGPALRDATPVTWTVALSLDGERLTVRFDARDTYTTGLGQTAPYRTGDGDPMRVTQRLRDGGVLEQVFQTDQGTRWYVWHHLSPDRVRIDATTQGEMMPEPMRYSLEYAR